MGTLVSIEQERGVAHALEAGNRRLAALAPPARIEWAFAELPGEHVLSSSFGAQAAVCLHLVTRIRADIPVVLIDTGYLFAETYRFVDLLTERLALNLQVFRPERSPAWQEARHGPRWERGLAGIESYNKENKVAPMRRALAGLGAGTWLAGLRRAQARTRARIPFLDRINGRWKVHPIADWSDRDVHRYLERHRLPYHPLWQRGYVSIGDQHSTRPIHEVATVEETRFFGLTRECGLHDSL